MSRHPRLRRHLLAAGLSVFLAGLPFSKAAVVEAAQAHFAYELCDPVLPGGAEPTLTFTPDAGGTIGPFDTCSQPNGSLYLYQLSPVATAAAVLDVTVPATTGGWVETETLSSGSYRLGPGNERSYVHDEGWPTPNGGEETRTFFEHGGPDGSSGSGTFPIVMTCSSASTPKCEASGGIYVRYITALETDPTPPSAPDLSGSAIAPGTLHGPQQLSATAADIGGGVRKLEVLVNGTAAGTPEVAACQVALVSNSSYGGLAATTPSPCPPTFAGSWNLETATAPFKEGANTIQICASDFATAGSPNTTCSPPQTVDVDNSCTESPVAGGTTLSGGFGRATAESVTLRYGAGAEIHGSLSGAAGEPLSGATICVETQTEGGGALRPVATATTDAHGRFSYRVGPGPNRLIVVGYRHGASELTKNEMVRSHARPHLAASPGKLKNGERVHLRGSLPEPAAAGRVVVLQANVPGSHRWITFRKATTGERGRFKASYHFTSTTRKIDYRFRALVARQADYPWLQGTSKPITVTVTR
jgi:hypothetical protein